MKGLLVTMTQLLRQNHYYVKISPLISRLKALTLTKIYANKNLSKCNTIEETVNFALYGPYKLSPLQVKEEIFYLMRLLIKIRPRVVCEIGTAFGGTLFLFSRASAPDATIISIDKYPKWKTRFYESFALEKQKIHLIRGDSHSSETVEKVNRILKGRQIDFIFIDGDHTYNGVKMDFETYVRFLRDGGIIALHDIVPHPQETGCEVNRLWNEIRCKYQNLEIVKDWKQGWAGIGIIYGQGFSPQISVQ